MINMTNRLSHFKENVRNKIRNIKNGPQKFKENFSVAKSKPRPKRNSFFLGVTTVIGIFGVTLLIPVLAAVAKDVPKNLPTPGEVSPAAPTQQLEVVPSQQIINSISATAATVCGLAVSSSPFIFGVAFGLILVIGILKAQGK